MKNYNEEFRKGLDLSNPSDAPNGGKIIEAADELIDLFQKGDDRCEFKIGNRIKKKTYEVGDCHQIGHEGIVIGSLYLEDEEFFKENYLVQFKGDEEICITVKYKIELI